MPRITVSVSTNSVGSECRDDFDVDDKEWDDMTEAEKEAMCFEAAMNWVDWDWVVS